MFQSTNMSKGNSREIRKFQERNRNENIIYQNIWDAVKAQTRGKFTAINKYIKKEENLTPTN